MTSPIVKNLLLISLALLLSCTGVGQTNDKKDSLNFAHAQWQTDSLDGFCLKRCHFDNKQLFDAAQHLFLIEIPQSSVRRLAFVCDSTPITVSEFGQRTNAYAAINGSFFDMDKGNPVCYLRIDGIALGENTPQIVNSSTNRKYYQHATMTLHNGRPSLVVPDSNRLWEETMKDSNIMTAGPMLIWKGKLVPQRNDRTFAAHRHNRTAVGLRPDGTTILLVADGRFRDEAEGLTLPELQRIMMWLGCNEAINLDGGGSSTMYVRDGGGVVNYPSDNKYHDHEGQRPVANAVVVL